MPLPGFHSDRHSRRLYRYRYRRGDSSLSAGRIIMPDSHESSLENDSRLLSTYPLADVFCRRRLGTGVCPYPNFDFSGPYLLPFGLPWAAGVDLRRSSTIERVTVPLIALRRKGFALLNSQRTVVGFDRSIFCSWAASHSGGGRTSPQLHF